MTHDIVLAKVCGDNKDDTASLTGSLITSRVFVKLFRFFKLNLKPDLFIFVRFI